jgi:phenylpyruvate tautomerase PptA (4-oxalocrotonate tautomerase family)
MPIIDIEVVSDESIDPQVVQAIADDLGPVFGVEPGSARVRMRTLHVQHYAENRHLAPLPVFVTVLVADPPQGEALREQVRYITEAVSQRTRRPRDHVHVLYEPAARGRLAFGGYLVE